MSKFSEYFSNKPSEQPIVTTPKANPLVNLVTMATQNTEFNSSCDYTSTFQLPQKTPQGYLYGLRGLFPEELNLLYDRSPLHSSICNFKQWLAVGQGYDIDTTSLTPDQKIKLFQITNQFDKMLEGMALDLVIHSRVYIETLWNNDNSKTLKLDRIAPEKIRIYDVNDKQEATKFIYNFDWLNYTKYTTKYFNKFDQLDKAAKCQVYQYQIESPGFRYYAKPSFTSGIDWIYIDSEMATYYKAIINNSLNPGMLIKYYAKVDADEQKAKVRNDFNQSFASAQNAGRAMILFWPDKASAPDIEQMKPQQLDAAFLSLVDTIQRQICYSHGLDPQILGLKTPGSLGNSSNLEYAFTIFNQSRVVPIQRRIENIFNEFLNINGIPTKVTLKNNSDLVAKIMLKNNKDVEGIQLIEEIMTNKLQ